MEQNTLTAELTDAENEQYEQKAEVLAKEKNVSKVHVVVQINPETLERSACYLAEPNYQTQIRVMDMAVNLGAFAAADQLREQTVIREASDAITYGDSPECNRYKLGVSEYCMGMVSRLQNQFKKK